MKKIIKLFVDKNIKAILDELDNIGSEFENTTAFNIVQSTAIKMVLKNKGIIDKIMIRDSIKPKQAAYSWINNVSGDMLESGQYHIYRGTLNPMGQGNDLLNIFDISINKLVVLGDMDKTEGEQHKKDMRNCINSVG